MAARYWVGGTATWDATAGTKWSTTSGGAGGAAVPTSVDNVYFNSASGTVTVTLGVAVNVNQIQINGFTGTFVSAGFAITCVEEFSAYSSPTATVNLGGSTVTAFLFAIYGTFTALTAPPSVVAVNNASGSGRPQVSGDLFTIVYPLVTCGTGVEGILLYGPVTITSLNLADARLLSLNDSPDAFRIGAITHSGTAPGDMPLVAPDAIETNSTTFAIIDGNGGSVTYDKLAFFRVHFQNGTFVANNSFNIDDVTGITINPPSGASVARMTTDINWGSLITTVPTPPYSSSDEMLFGEPNGLAVDFLTLNATVKEIYSTTPVLSDNFSTYANDAALQAVWTGQVGVVVTLDAGRMKLTNGAGAGNAYRSFATNPGSTYSVSIDLTGGTTFVDAVIGSTVGGSDLLAIPNVAAGAGPTTRTGTFTALGLTTWIRIRTGSLAGGTCFADNISITQSVNNNFSGKAMDLLTYTAPSPKMVWFGGKLGFAGHNLITYSEQLDNVIWGKTGVTVLTNQIAAPDGMVTADKVMEVAAAGTPRIVQSVTSTVAGYVYRFFIYAKAAERSQIRIVHEGQGGRAAYFDLLAGTVLPGVVPPTEASISSAGNGWYRCSVTYTATTTTSQTYVATAEGGATIGSGDATKGVYLWGAQFQRAPATDFTYIPTTTTVRYALPLDRDPLTDAPLGVLVEEARTNAIFPSIPSGTWSAVQGSYSANAAIAPDGTMTAAKLLPSTTSSTHDFYRLANKAASAIQVVCSVYVKMGEYPKCRFRMQGNGTLHVANFYFDLINGTMYEPPTTAGDFSGASGSIQNVGNGWFRLVGVATTDAILGITTVITPLLANGGGVFVGDGVSGIYAWGAQTELSVSFPTSYIPTVTATVTRTRDDISLATTKFPLNAVEGSLVAGWVPGHVSAGTSARILWLDDTDQSSYTEMISIVQNGALARISANDSTVTQIAQDAVGAISVGAASRVAAAYKLDDYAIALNGGTVGVDTSATVPTGFDQLRFGCHRDATALNGRLRDVQYLPRRMTNTELQMKSAP